MKQLAGGTFNTRYGRRPRLVRDEVHAFLAKHDLDFLCFQEGGDYAKVLQSIDGYFWFADTSRRGGTNTGILVRGRYRVSRVTYRSFGDGWTTVRGGRQTPVPFPRLTIDGWARVGSVHMPNPTDWRDGDLQIPYERRDDYMGVARKVKRFQSIPDRLTRCSAGDWNEPPETVAPWSPGWIAEQTGSTCAAPTSRVGHGRIDWTMVKRGHVTHIEKDLELAEDSDHEPVSFILEGVTR